MKLGFYVSGKATRLKKLIHYMSGKRDFAMLLHDFSFVYRDNDGEDDLPAICHGSNIAFYRGHIAAEKKDERSAILSRDLLFRMVEHQADYLMVFGSRLLKGEILDRYRNRIINFHPSLLPAFPGVRSIDQAFDYGSFLIGNTAHFIDEGVDTGQIIMQNICIAGDCVEYDKILDNQIPMFIQIVLWLKQNRIRLKGRRVFVEHAKYSLGDFIPNIENDELKMIEE